MYSQSLQSSGHGRGVFSRTTCTTCRHVPLRSTSKNTELRSCVKVEVDALGSPSLIVLMVSVDVKHHVYLLIILMVSVDVKQR